MFYYSYRHSSVAAIMVVCFGVSQMSLEKIECVYYSYVDSLWERPYLKYDPSYLKYDFFRPAKTIRECTVNYCNCQCLNSLYIVSTALIIILIIT